MVIKTFVLPTGLVREVTWKAIGEGVVGEEVFIISFTVVTTEQIVSTVESRQPKMKPKKSRNCKATRKQR
jgi:hypothetical protein